MTQEEKKKNAIPKVKQVKGEAQTNTGAPVNPNTQPPQTISDMLAPLRNAAKIEKTEAVKMQKYHALTDAFNALGKMGGAAIGGAIGGNALDSAPNVGEYQPSRGYVDAFEKAKAANERLRAIDDMEFKLAVDKQQKDADRAYNDKVRQEDRNYRSAEAQLEREWNMKFYDYKTQIEQAIADKNWARSAELQQKMAADAQAHEIKMQNLRNSGSLAEAQVRQETARLQAEKPIPVYFEDNTVMEIPKTELDAIKTSLMGQEIGGIRVNDTTIDEVIRKNPQLIKERLALRGLMDGASYTASSTEPGTQQPATVQEDTTGTSKSDKKRKKQTIVGGPGRFGGPIINKGNKKEPDVEGDKDLGVTWN